MSPYSVYVIPRAWDEIKGLPGNIRQQVKKAVDELAEDPRPPRSRRLRTERATPELYRLRLDRWRIVYAITEEYKLIDVLAVRRRPPYDYGDMDDLIAEMLG